METGAEAALGYRVRASVCRCLFRYLQQHPPAQPGAGDCTSQAANTHGHSLRNDILTAAIAQQVCTRMIDALWSPTVRFACGNSNLRV